MKNAEQYITNTLTSLQAQNYKNMEILIIDDGSTDESKQKVKEFCEKNAHTMKFKDMKRLIDANLEIANIRTEVDSKDKMYINTRIVMLPVVLSWLYKNVSITKLICIK